MLPLSVGTEACTAYLARLGLRDYANRGWSCANLSWSCHQAILRVLARDLLDVAVHDRLVARLGENVSHTSSLPQQKCGLLTSKPKG